MRRFWRVVRGGAGQHDGDRESPSFVRQEEAAEEGKGGVQGHEDGVSLQVVVVVAVVLVLLVGLGTAAGRG